MSCAAGERRDRQSVPLAAARYTPTLPSRVTTALVEAARELGTEPTASFDAQRAAYRRTMALVHPDVAGADSTGRAQAANLAFALWSALHQWSQLGHARRAS